jgi:hypothetical protein
MPRLVVAARALWPAPRRHEQSRSIVALSFLSTVAIGLFFCTAWRSR